MNIIQVKILNDRTVELEAVSGGVSGENGITQLKFILPEDYYDFYKYLDIIKADGSKTQTMAGNRENHIFYYTVPYSLTESGEIYIQLVAKKESKVFKSNVFSLYFNGGIEATQLLLSDYQDTIEYLMENKADVEAIGLLSKSIDDKVNKSEFNTFYMENKTELDNKASGEELSLYQSETEKALNTKVNKEDGKILSSNDYTDEEKEKLKSLPENTLLTEMLSKKVPLITIPLSDTEETVPIEEVCNQYSEPGIFFFKHYRNQNEYTEITYYKLINEMSDEMYQYLIDINGVTKSRCITDEEWRVIAGPFTSSEKEKLSALPKGEEISEKFSAVNYDISEIKNNASNAVKGKQTGETLSITDVSPIEHSMNIKIHSKNLFDLKGQFTVQTPYGTWEKTDTGFKVTSTAVNGAQSIRLWIPAADFEVGKTYTFSSSLVSNNMGIHLVDAIGEASGIVAGNPAQNTNKLTFTITEKKPYLRLYIYNANVPVDDVYYANEFQIEEGEEITEYEAFIDPAAMTVTVNGAEYAPSEDGTVENVKSSYPIAEITSDTSGAIITCEYNRDVNKVIEELTNAIVSLGGNV